MDSLDKPIGIWYIKVYKKSRNTIGQKQKTESRIQLMVQVYFYLLN